MGVTIHFEGRARDSSAMEELLAAATRYADKHGWAAETINNPMATLLRVRNEEDWDYTGPVSGIAFFPAGNCEPIRLEFDDGLYIQEYTKTQFAGADTHIAIVGLLTAIEPFLSSFKVEDEGEYWETHDRTLLEEHIESCERAFDQLQKEHPNARIQVKTPSGRIIDLIK